jgi:uncharacterized membrane protein YqjE
MSTKEDDRGVSDQSTASLVIGILDDLENLVKQQFRLTKSEIELEVYEKALELMTFTAGLALLLVAAILLSLGLVHLLHWSLSDTVNDVSRFPLWVCHMVIGSVVGVIGAIVVRRSKVWLGIWDLLQRRRRDSYRSVVCTNRPK